MYKDQLTKFSKNNYLASPVLSKSCQHSSDSVIYGYGKYINQSGTLNFATIIRKRFRRQMCVNVL